MPSIYICIFAIIAIFAFISLFRKDWDKELYYVGFYILTVFLCLRFGQGTDYPSYWNIYQRAELALDPSMGFIKFWKVTGGEIGWQFLMYIFQLLNTDFRIVMGIISLATMLCTHRAIVTYCEKYKTISLVLVYPTVFLTYYFSGIRQGLIMAAFFGILLKWAMDKKYLRYVVGVLLLCSIHTASISYLIVPLILLFKKRMYIFCTVASIVFCVCMFVEPLRNILIYFAGYFGRAGKYMETVSFSLLSLLERVAMLVIILFLWCRSSDEKTETEKKLLKIYYTGFLIYICLCFSPMVASRLAIMFKMAEMFLVPLLLADSKDIARKLGACIFCGIAGLMMYKNMNSYAVLGKYNEGISGWNYPYVTVFNYEDILDYRKAFVYEPFDFREEEQIGKHEF